MIPTKTDVIIKTQNETHFEKTRFMKLEIQNQALIEACESKSREIKDLNIRIQELRKIGPGAHRSSLDANGMIGESLEFNVLSYMVTQGNDIDSRESFLQDEALEQIRDLKDKLDRMASERHML